jgi:mannose/fructose-specific phosphotransferase system component IIA
MIRCLVMTHGNIGAELVRVVELILGPVEGMTALSNAGKSGPDLQADVKAWLDAGENDDGELIFIDDYGGSCANAAIIACGEHSQRAIISGVNLAMLLGYTTWRDRDDHRELAAKLVQKGREAIILVGGR